MADAYENVAGGTLKLKGFKPEKKKKKKTKEAAIKAAVAAAAEQADPTEKKEVTDYREILTPAQKRAQLIMEQREIERIKKLAAKSHKEKVEEFNEKLDKLTEHYDIPKVSWTK
eukprot:Colp12_sorted_trinity150504_noHs@31800